MSGRMMRQHVGGARSRSAMQSEERRCRRVVLTYKCPICRLCRVGCVRWPSGVRGSMAGFSDVYVTDIQCWGMPPEDGLRNRVWCSGVRHVCTVATPHGGSEPTKGQKDAG